MITTYLVGNLSLNNNTRVNDYLLTTPDDSVIRPKTYSMPSNLYSTTLLIPDNHTSFICGDDDHPYYTKNQMNIRLKTLESNVNRYTDSVIPDHFVAVVE